jgi:2-hydroxychromene-2-carboxylate isomerase
MQNQAMNNAGAIAGNQNIGANNLMNAGNIQAGFDQTKLNADIARHDYGQNAQQQHLSNYTNAVWGAPGGSTSTTSNSGGGK